MDNISAAICIANRDEGLWFGYDLVADQYGLLRSIIINGWYQLRKYSIEHAYKRYGPLENAFDHLGVLFNSNIRCIIIPGISCRCGIVDILP